MNGETPKACCGCSRFFIVISWIALILVIIGALNWGMIGFFNLDIIRGFLGVGIARIIYAIVGLAGIWSFSFFKLLCHIACRNKP